MPFESTTTSFLTISLTIIASLAVFLWLIRNTQWLANLLVLPRDALQTLLGMSAKLACSAHHISGFRKKRISEDLRNYSPLFKFVSIEHRGNTTLASLGSLISMKAHYDPILGSSLIPSEQDENNPTFNFPGTIPTSVNLRRNLETLARRSHQPLQRMVQEQIRRDAQASLDTRALIVVHGHEILAEAYGPDITASTRLLGWSMSKSLLALLFGRMETLGLAYAARTSLFPEWCDDDRTHISLQNLLQMCDGLEFDETYSPGTDATRMLFGNLPASRYALQRKLKFQPGTHFSYSSGSTNLIARWMHRELGGTQKALTFWQQEFLKPLGLTSMLLELDNDGVFIGSSYGFATAAEWAQLGALLLHKGQLNRGNDPQGFLDHEWITRATQPNTSNNDPRYGYQLWLNGAKQRASNLPLMYPGLPEHSYFMLGNREQMLMVAPEKNTVVLRLGWSATPYPVEDRFGEILHSLPT
ncbi:serine hydrolase [Microbulbifer agarilyticus]|uniref:serine hydrolase domain-containing protein n=1 Tax=Microbulbifer agarilyticus TaxID=260552 RepID=UPI001C97D3F7|nr:serine hydrolase [Microbulbifer agarilyticus]MBY6212359.1 serine hydrolase [Microbulbifer agarilyticus]